VNPIYLKLKALNPIHIGTGEVYEPTNYVIDNGYLYEFDEMLFLQNLSASQRGQYTTLLKQESVNGYELFQNIHAFIIRHKTQAIEVAHSQVKVSDAFETKYTRDIAIRVKTEGKNRNTTNVFNKFEIQKTQRTPNSGSVYISGSSIKGAISTAYQEMLYRKNKDINQLESLFGSDNKSQKLFRNLSISDTLAQKATAKIAFAVNKELFESDDAAEISTMIEVNEAGSEYLICIDIKSLKDDKGDTINESITINKIIESCNAHYKKIYKDKEKKDISTKDNQFLLSVGKHSGAKAVTIEGLRKILVKIAEIKNKKEEEDDAQKRVDRLYRKSQFESEKTLELLADELLLSDKKEKDIWLQGKHFLETPSQLEDLVETKNSLTINAILKQETTMWRFSDTSDGYGQSFGWLLCEVIDLSKFENTLKEFRAYEKKSVEEVRAKQIAILAQIEERKQQSLNEKKKMENDARLEKEKEEKEEKKKAEELEKLSLCRRQFEQMADTDKSNTPKYTLLLQEIKKGAFDSCKCEMVTYLKELMQDAKKWKETTSSKKPARDNEYQKTLEVIKLIEECK